MLWHFCEEIEHRSSAIAVYDHVVGNRLYRMKHLPKVLEHNKADLKAIHAGFTEHVPVAPTCGTKGAFDRIPAWQKARMVVGIFGSQIPWHNPARGHVPDYYGTWRTRYERGDDMTVENLSSGQAVPAK